MRSLFQSGRHLDCCLTEEHEDVPLGRTTRHQYVYGTMNKHNVVMGCLPATQLGIGAAAAVASEMASNFELEFGLLVGAPLGQNYDSYRF